MVIGSTQKIVGRQGITQITGSNYLRIQVISICILEIRAGSFLLQNFQSVNTRTKPRNMMSYFPINMSEKYALECKLL